VPECEASPPCGTVEGDVAAQSAEIPEQRQHQRSAQA
jgi:hypothetical protein